jgi:hypothetical protein
MYICLCATELTTVLGDRITCPIQPSNLVHDQQKLGDLQGDLNLVGSQSCVGGFIAEIRTSLTPLTGLGGEN